MPAFTAPPNGALPDPALSRLFAELRVIRELLENTRKPLLTVTEVARLVGRDAYTVRRWIKEKRLPATRVSGTGPKGRLLVRRDDLDRLMAAGHAAEPEGT